MEKKNKGYFDVDFDVEKILVEGGMIDELFYLKDLQQRRLILATDVEQASIWDISKNIIQYNKEDMDIPVEDRKPIILYIASRGGDVDAGLELIDTIQASKTPVYTVNMGYEYSMGFLIGLAGHKRFAMQHAKFLHHDGTAIVMDSGTKVQDRMEFNKKIDEKIKDYVLSRSRLTPEEYDEKLRVEWYMFADEAKAKGFVDYIVGVDCTIDEIA